MMKLNSKMLGLLVIVIMFGGIWLTSMLGKWNTGTSKEPSLIISGEAAGKPNPADIRGSYTFGDIEKGYSIPLVDLKIAFRLPENEMASTFQVKSLESVFAAEAAAGKEIGADSMRLFVANYANLPFTVSSDIWLPREAVEILKKRGNLTTGQVQYLENHIAGGNPALAGSPAPVIQSTLASPIPGTAVEGKKISGSTTFQQLLDWGLSKDVIETIIGAPIPAAGTTIKDYFTQKGLEFSTYKQNLQIEVDKKQ